MEIAPIAAARVTTKRDKHRSPSGICLRGIILFGICEGGKEVGHEAVAADVGDGANGMAIGCKQHRGRFYVLTECRFFVMITKGDA